MEWRQVLVPLDGSAFAEAAIPYAHAVAWATGAAVTLLMARPLPPAHGMSDAEATAYLESRAAPLRSSGVRTAVRTGAGDPAAIIFDVAERLDVAAVVMATHGRGGIARIVAGSVAGRVLQESTRPVLVIRPPETRQTVTLGRIVVPLDGSPLAESALAPAVDLARAASAAVTLLRVEPAAHGREEPVEGGALLPDVTHAGDRQAVTAGLYLAEVRATLPADVRIEAMVLRGVAGMVLPEVLAGEGVDLVVMSTHGRGGVRRLLLGSVAERVVRAGVPVLLIRPWPAEAAPEGRSVTQ